MTDWTQRKIKSLSSVPLWLEGAVEEYKKREGLQSWSHALMELAVHALLMHYVESETVRETILFGDKEFESMMYQKFVDEKPSEDDEHLIAFWKEQITPNRHGGDRSKQDAD